VLASLIIDAMPQGAYGRSGLQYSYRLTSSSGSEILSHEYFEKLQPFLTRGGKSYESCAARLVHPA